MKDYNKIPECTMFTGKRSHVCMSSYMFFEHRRFFTSDATFRAHIPTATPASNISVFFVAFKTPGKAFAVLITGRQFAVNTFGIVDIVTVGLGRNLVINTNVITNFMIKISK